VYLLYCDETNLERRDNDFFVYAGLIIPGAAASHLSAAIDGIRANAGILRDFPLKFNPGPAHLDHQQFANVKEQVIQAVVGANCALCTSLILHNVATSADDARRNAINQLSYNFNCHLGNRNDHGIVLIDRFSDTQIDSHLRDKFSLGVTGLPFTPVMRLERVLGFHYSAIGQSHFASAIDIVLGCLRFSVNAFTRNDAGKLPRAQQFLGMLSPLFLRTPYSGPHGPWVTDISLYFSPRTIKSDRYRK
jgi:hypothetical protein